MKRIIGFLLFATAVSSVMAQNTETTMLTTLALATDRIATIEKDYNTIVRMEFDLVHKASPKATYRYLYNTKTYCFEAFGQRERIGDVDIKVYLEKGGDWELVASESSSNSEAFIKFTPEVSGQYRINISAYDFKSNYTVGHYGLIIYHE